MMAAPLGCDPPGCAQAQAEDLTAAYLAVEGIR